MSVSAIMPPRGTPRPESRSPVHVTSPSLAALAALLATLVVAGCDHKAQDCSTVLGVHDRHDAVVKDLKIDSLEAAAKLAATLEAESKELAALTDLEDEGVRTRARALSEADATMAGAMRDMNTKTRAMKDAFDAVKAIAPAEKEKVIAGVAEVDALVEDQKKHQETFDAAAAASDRGWTELAAYCRGAGTP